MSILRHSAWAASAAVVLTVARFGLSAILARRLTQVGFGQFAYAQWMVDLAFLVCSLGATAVASRYIAEFRSRPDRLAQLIARWRPFAFGLPVLASAAVTIGAMVSGLHLEASTSLALAAWAFASGLWSMQTAALSGLQRFDLVFRANLVAAVIMLLGSLLLPLAGDHEALLFALMASASMTAAMVGITATWHLADGSLKVIEPESWRGIRGYALNMWITGLLWSLVWSRGEMPIVRAYLGDSGVAHYAAAMALFGGAMQGVMLAVSGVAPQLTLLWGSERRDEAIATARSVMDVQLLFCSAGAMALICLGPELVSLVYGNAYRQASAPLAVLAIGLLAMATSCQNYLLQIATDGRFSRNITMLGLIALFGAAFMLTPSYGLIGAAFARSSAMLLLAVIAVAGMARRWGRVAIGWRNVLVTTVAVGASSLAVTWMGNGSLLARFVILCIAVLVLVLSMRDRHGRLLSLALPRVLLPALRNGGSGNRGVVDVGGVRDE